MHIEKLILHYTHIHIITRSGVTPSQTMKLLAKILLPLIVLGACIFAARAVIANRPEPSTRPQFKQATTVEATTLQPENYTVTLESRGEVSAARQGSLVSEVAGSIVDVSPDFVVGGSFKKGELLMQIDPRDYQIALTLAEADFAQANAQLAEQQARAEQAAADWKSLGRKGKPTDLTLRKPQLAAARAALEAARGKVQRAQLDLERTNITAMYDGRISSKQSDLGQYVNKGSVVAQIYSTGNAEVRLPFTSNQLKHIDLDYATANKSIVTLQADISGTPSEWQAQLARTEGIDPTSRQFYAVAQLADPYSQSTPLRVGQFVEAKLKGKTMDNVFVIPRSALREDKKVLIVDTLGTLISRDVVVEWKDAEVAVISSGLETGEVLNLTSLGSVTNGTKVQATIDGVAPQVEKQQFGRPGKDGKKRNGGQAPQQSEQFGRLKKMVDSGEEIPARARQRVQAKIDAGEEVPPWLKKHLAKTAK